MSSDPAMTDIVKGMTSAYANATPDSWYSETAMRAALLWLAANVSDEMVREYLNCISDTKDSLSAAIRAAAGEEGK
jgi:hypothetical protein